MGMTLSVYRDHLGDCTNGGLSSKATRICVINVDGPFVPSADMPAFRLVEGAFKGQVVLVPVDQPEGLIGPMFGGNMAYTSDSRFSAKVRKLTDSNFYGAVPIHDRFETQAEYDILCR